MLNPQVIVEVLSDSTEKFDRGNKFRSYRLINSMQDYLLISQHEMSVEIFRRKSGGNWLMASFDKPNDVVTFESLQCEFTLEAVYAKVELTV